MRLIQVMALCFILSAAASADTTWTLNNVTFTDGATATGFFTIDSTFDALTAWDINVQGSNLGADFHYTSSPQNSNFFNISSTEVAVASSPFAEFAILFPNSPMTNAGGTLSLVTGLNIPPGSGDCAPSGACGFLASGSLAAISSVPEPSMAWLAAFGVLGLGAYRKNRSAKS